MDTVPNQTEPRSSRKKSALTLRYILYISGFVDLFGVSLLIPLLSREARKYDASPFAVGLFGSLYGLLQLFSGPLIGFMSDHFGRTATLLLCLFGASTGYFMLGLADSFFLLILSRIPSGIFKHSQSLIRACLVDITPNEERPTVFGMANSISSIGFIAGPIIGGHLVTTNNGFSRVALLTTISFWLNAALVYVAVKNMDIPLLSKTPDEESKSGHPKKPLSIGQRIGNVFSTLIYDIRMIPWHSIWDIFIVRFFGSLALILFRSNFATVLELLYHSPPETIGYIIAFNSIMSSVGGFLVGRISKLFPKNSQLHNFFLFGAFLSLTCWAFSDNITTAVLLLIPLCISTSVVRACSQAIVYHKASDQEVGLITGLSHSTLSVSRMLAPAMAGLCQELSVYAPGVVAASLAGLALAIALFSDLDGPPYKVTKKD